MKGYLLDTNILSELRKPRRNPSLIEWIASVPAEELFLSVLTLGEIRRGIELLRVRDKSAAGVLEAWLKEMTAHFGDRILPIDEATAQTWGALSIAQPLPSVDGLLAATALNHGLTLVSRNTRDFVRSGVETLNPFTS